jgi:hypothetical protein
MIVSKRIASILLSQETEDAAKL